MKHIDLFSGIGGFALAARWAGIETIQFVELDKFCQKVLRKNFPGVAIHGDIKTYKYENTGLINNANGFGKHTGRGEIQGQDEEISQRDNDAKLSDTDKFSNKIILTGGFPCQPYSVAGKRKGKDDDRALWPEMLRVIQEVNPDWIIGENVAGFINMGFDEAASDLENEGYEVEAFNIPACGINAPHKRERIWIVGHRTDTNNGGNPERSRTGKESYTDKDGLRERINNDRYEIRNDTGNADRPGGEFTANAKRGKHGGLRFMGKAEGSQIGNELSGISNRLYGENSGWSQNWLEVAAELCRVDDGLPAKLDRVARLKGLGNSIVPQLAYIFFERIKIHSAA